MALNRLRNSLRWKLVLASTLITLVMLGLLLANTMRLLNDTIEEQGRQRINEISPVLNVALAPALFRRDYASTQEILTELVKNASASLEYLVVLDERGQHFAHVGTVNIEALPAAEAAPISSHMLFNGALPLQIGSQPVGELRYGLSFATLIKARNSVLYQSILIALITVALTIAALVLMGYWLTRHLERLVATTRAISAGNYDARIEIETSDEIGHLAQRFNEMSDAVRANVQALRLRKERFRSMMELSSDWYWEQDEQLRFRDVENSKAELRAPGFVGKQRWDLADTNLTAGQWAAHRAQLERHEPFHDFEYQRLGRDGKQQWVSISGLPIFDDQRCFRGYRGVGKVITERKEAEAVMARRGRLLDESDNEIYLFRADDLRFVSVNKGALRSLGYSMKEMLTLTPVDIKPEFTEKSFAELVAPLRAGTRAQLTFETVHQRKDGSTYPVEVRLHLSRTEDPPMFIAFILDITDRKMAEQALRESEERFRILFEQAAVGVAQVESATGRFVRVNQSYANIVGYAIEEMLQQTFQNITHRDDLPLNLAHLKRLMAGEVREFNMEKRCFRKDGAVVWVNLTVSPMWKPGTTPTYHIAVVENIDERKRAEEAVQQLNVELERRVKERTAQLEAINKELETFTYSVSHDLKAPLRGIDGYSRLLLEQHTAQLDDEGRRFLHNVRRATLQMNQLIDDLLAYSRMERRVLQTTSVNVQVLIDTLLAECVAEVQNRGIAVTVSLPCAAVRADRDGLTMALRNLLDNALKFSRDVPQPAIEIGGRDSGASYTLWVRDNGTGFDMKFHDRIFDMFQRLHRAEDYPGTGVGLAIVRKAMERMGGRAWAQSEPGKDTTFYLEIPL